MTVAVAMMLAAAAVSCTQKDDGGGTQTSSGSAVKSASATAAKTTEASKTTAKATASATGATGAGTAAVTAAQESSTAGDGGQTAEGEGESTLVDGDDGQGSGEVTEEPVIDMKGQTILLSYYGTTAPDFAANAQYAVFGKRLEEAQEKFNFKIEKINFGGTNTAQYGRDLITQMIAGLRTTDIATISTFSHYLPFVKNKILLELDDKINFEDPLLKAYGFLYNFKWKGKHYVLTPGPEVALGSWTTPYNIGSLQYNKVIFDREGQPDPLDLALANQWNWSTFLDVCINVTKDIDGNGITDQWAITSDSPLYYAQMMLYSNGAILLKQDEASGRYLGDIFDVKAQRAWQFISDLAYIHKVVKLPFPSSTVAHQNYSNGICAMFLNVAGYNSRHQAGTYGPALKTSYVAPVPLGPDVNDYLLVVNPTLYGVMVNTPYADQIGDILKYVMVSWDENLKTLPYLQDVMNNYPKLWEPGGSGADRIVITTEKEYQVNFNIFNKKMYIDYYIIGDYKYSNMVRDMIVNPLMKGEKSVVQALDSAKSSLEAFIDEYCEQ